MSSNLTITGPISGGKYDRPFGTALVDLAAHGYVEEEFFFEGEAPRYRPVGELGLDGVWTVERSDSVPFKTRALVRRPNDPARFNGTVIVEWNNVSAGLEIFEQGETQVIFDEGFAYVGVSAQRVGVHGFDFAPQGLQTWDPERYGSLHIEDDALSYGIFDTVAKTLRTDGAAGDIDPLDGLEVKRVLAIGGSQSAGRLVSYLNAVQPLERTFDGFIAFTWFGSGSSIDDPSVIDLAKGGLAGLARFPTRVRADLEVPVMVVNSECETLSCYPVRQPDTDLFRFWEVAGAPHAPRVHMELILPKLQRDGVDMPGEIDPEMLSPVPWAPVFDAALSHVARWMDGGTPPPSQPPIEVEVGVEGAPAKIRRDDDGNAIGGVRVPEQAVSLSRNVGAIEEAGTAGLMGVWSPLPTEIVLERYPDQSAYLAAFAAAAQAAVDAGVLREVDASAANDRAAARVFPAATPGEK
ncbi:MAG: signal peptide-containing protein [Pseudonocardiales bacterium]|nr:signal peptide-containing protein [Pseudonocardiales bacterium]